MLSYLGSHFKSIRVREGITILVNKGSMNFVIYFRLVYMVPIDAHSVSATMRITTTCSLNAPILKRSGGMFVTDATFQE